MAKGKLNRKDLANIRERVVSLAAAEVARPGFIVGRCNCTNEANRKYFRELYKDDPEKAELCVKWLEEHGGYCNCKVLFNVYPIFAEKQKGF